MATIDLIVAVVAVGNILACLWLIWWTARAGPAEEPGSLKEPIWDEDLQELNNPMPRWWLGLFVLTIGFALAYLILYPSLQSFDGTLGWTQQRQHDEQLAKTVALRQAHFARFAERDAMALSRDPQALRAGAGLFAEHCAGCHGPRASGAIGFPDLTDSASLYGADASSIRSSIGQGRRGRMPAQVALLQESQIENLVALLSDWNDPQLTAEQHTAARTTFDQRCAVCHGVEARGNPLLGAPDLRDAVWLHGGSREALRYSIVFGRSGEMPAQASRLSPTEIELLTAYILWLSSGAGGG